MKKFFIVLFSLFLVVGKVYAVTADDTKINISNYETSNFKEILEEEKIELKNKDYKETSDQIVIYLFRGNGCHYCQGFLNFLNSISDEYGKYFKVVGFEVWSNQENSKLLQQISSFKGDAAGGVPYILIGEEVFPGYADSYDDAIKQAIKSLYDSKDRYDVFEEYNKAVDKAKKQANGNAPTIIFWNFIFILASTITIILINNKKHKELLEEIQLLKNNKPKEVIKDVKKKK